VICAVTTKLPSMGPRVNSEPTRRTALPRS
jgi:hypothetical protein